MSLLRVDAFCQGVVPHPVDSWCNLDGLFAQGCHGPYAFTTFTTAVHSLCEHS